MLAFKFGFDTLAAMPRPRKNDPGSVVTPLVDQFAARLGQTLERFITTRIAKETKDAGTRRPGRAPTRARRGKTFCYYPGCKNVAAPRFGMFCAALHKDLPKAEKERYRAQRLKAEAKKAAKA